MAIFSTHLLNSVNGTHAANVKIIIYKIHEDKRNIFIEGETDNSGRMQNEFELTKEDCESCLLYTSPSPRDLSTSRMPSSA